MDLLEPSASGDDEQYTASVPVFRPPPDRSRYLVLVWQHPLLHVLFTDPEKVRFGSREPGDDLTRIVSNALNEWQVAVRESARTPSARGNARASLEGRGRNLVEALIPRSVRQAMSSIPEGQVLKVVELGEPKQVSIPIELMGWDRGLWATQMAVVRPHHLYPDEPRRMRGDRWCHAVGDGTFHGSGAASAQDLRNLPNRVKRAAPNGSSFRTLQVTIPAPCTVQSLTQELARSCLATIHSLFMKDEDQGSFLRLSAGFAGILKPVALHGSYEGLDLVVLNACHSADSTTMAGVIEGFVENLLKSGCGSVFATLSGVESQEIALGLEKLLTAWTQADLELSDALLATKQQAWTNHELSPMLYVLFGNSCLRC